MTDVVDTGDLCALCDVPHPDDSPAECRLAAERARLGAELDDLLTELPAGAEAP